MNKKLVKTMIILYYFTDRLLQVGFKITLQSHQINHSNSKLTFNPIFLEIGNDFRYFKKILKGMSVIYACFINQYQFRHRTTISARVDKQDKDNQLVNETEVFIILNINHRSTETDIDNIDNYSPLDGDLINLIH